MARPLKAHQLRVGSVLRPQHVQFPGVHYVTHAEFIGASKVKVSTNIGEWVFGREEDAVFPRREDGSTRDWKNGEAMVTDLCVGDTLPDADGNESVRRTVTSVRRAGEQTARIGFSSAESDILRHDFPFGVPVAFPAPMVAQAAKRQRSLTYADIKTLYGPYVGWHKHEERYVWLFIAKHPTGHGHWPKFFRAETGVSGMQGFRLDEKTFIVKPPKTAFPMFAGEVAHPEDMNPPGDKKRLQSLPGGPVPTIAETLERIQHGDV